MFVWPSETLFIANLWSNFLVNCRRKLSVSAVYFGMRVFEVSSSACHVQICSLWKAFCVGSGGKNSNKQMWLAFPFSFAVSKWDCGQCKVFFSCSGKWKWQAVCTVHLTNNSDATNLTETKTGLSGVAFSRGIPLPWHHGASHLCLRWQEGEPFNDIWCGTPGGGRHVTSLAGWCNVLSVRMVFSTREGGETGWTFVPLLLAGSIVISNTSSVHI